MSYEFLWVIVLFSVLGGIAFQYEWSQVSRYFRLKRLRSHVRSVLNDLDHESQEGEKELPWDDAVNWADLDVVSIQQVYELDDSVCYVVVISEVSPKASRFQAEVRRRLRLFGYQNEVLIRTEW